MTSRRRFACLFPVVIFIALRALSHAHPAPLPWTSGVFDGEGLDDILQHGPSRVRASPTTLARSRGDCCRSRPAACRSRSLPSPGRVSSAARTLGPLRPAESPPPEPRPSRVPARRSGLPARHQTRHVSVARIRATAGGVPCSERSRSSPCCWCSPAAPLWAEEVSGKIQKVDTGDRSIVLEDGTQLWLAESVSADALEGRRHRQGVVRGEGREEGRDGDRGLAVEAGDAVRARRPTACPASPGCEGCPARRRPGTVGSFARR